MPAPVMGDTAVTGRRQKKTLICKGVGVKRPAVTEHDGLPFSPILVIETCSVLCREGTRHVISPFVDWLVYSLFCAWGMYRESRIRRYSLLPFHVMGRAKPATSGRVKTSHFEGVPYIGSQKENHIWPIGSRWRKYKQSLDYWRKAGRIGVLPGSLASTGKRSDAMPGFGLRRN